MPRPPGIWATPSDAIFTGEVPVTSRPSRRTFPPLGGVSPVMARSSVDLPAPLVPSTARTSPSSTSMLTSKRIWVRP